MSKISHFFRLFCCVWSRRRDRRCKSSNLHSPGGGGGSACLVTTTMVMVVQRQMSLPDGHSLLDVSEQEQAATGQSPLVSGLQLVSPSALVEGGGGGLLTTAAWGHRPAAPLIMRDSSLGRVTIATPQSPLFDTSVLQVIAFELDRHVNRLIMMVDVLVCLHVLGLGCCPRTLPGVQRFEERHPCTKACHLKKIYSTFHT